MKDRYTMIFPNYTIGVEAYEKIREVCPRYGKSVVVIGGRKGIEAAQEKMVRAVEGVGLEFTGFIHAGGQSSDENIERISEDSAVQEADMIFAVGGGKAIDTAKAVAHRQNKPYFTFPTVAGSCAAAASIATIYTPEGKFQDYLYSTIPPVHVFLCSRIMAQAPVEYLLRGIGDTMAKYYEAAIASRGRKLQHRDGMGIALSRMCLDPLYAYGEQAVADNRRHVVSPAFEEVILAIVMTSGLVSNFAAPTSSSWSSPICRRPSSAVSTAASSPTASCSSCSAMGRKRSSSASMRFARASACRPAARRPARARRISGASSARRRRSRTCASCPTRSRRTCCMRLLRRLRRIIANRNRRGCP